MKSNKGITLIALVITIIVLLILAGVSIAMLSGDNSILGNASKSSDANKIGEIQDEIALKVNEYVMAYLDKKYNGTATKLTGLDSATSEAGAVLAALDTFSSVYNDPATKGKVEYSAPTASSDGTITITSNKWKSEGTVKATGAVTWGAIQAASAATPTGG